MKFISYSLAGAAVAGIFAGGYWLGGGTLPNSEKESVVPISSIAPAPKEKSSIRIQLDENKKKDADSYELQGNLEKNSSTSSFHKQTQEELAASVRASGVPEEDVEAVAQTLADLSGAPKVPDMTNMKPQPQTMEELVSSVRASGVPEEDVEAVAQTLADLTGIDSEMSALPALTTSQQEDVSSSVRASGVPEEDVEAVAQTLGVAALADEEFVDEGAISYEEIVAAARADGVPEEDVEAVAETIAAPELQNSVPDQAEQAKKKAEAAAGARDAGVPEEDVEAVAETLVGAESFSKEE